MEKANTPSDAKPRLLDQVRDKIRLKHYSLRTEEAYVDWIRRFILFQHKRHPRDRGAGVFNPFGGGREGDQLDSEPVS